MNVDGKIEEIRDIDQLDRLSEEWKRIQSLSQTKHPFLDWTWIRLWAERMVFENKELLFIVVLNSEGIVVGIAPFQINKSPFFTFIEGFAQEFCDYIDWLCVPGFERQVGEIVFNSLDAKIKQKSCDFIRIYNIFPGSVAYRAFYSLGSDSLSRHNIAPEIMIKGTFENYLRSLKKKFVSDTERRKRKLDREVGCANYFLLHDRHKIPEIVNLIAKWLSDRRADKKETSYLDRGGMKQHVVNIYRKLYDIGRLHLSGLEINGQIIALNVAFEYQNKLFSYTPVFDKSFAKYGIMRLLKLRHIEECFSTGKDVYDFCLGGEEYKFNFRPEIKQLFSFTKYGITQKGRVRKLFDRHIKKYLNKNKFLKQAGQVVVGIMKNK